MVRKATRRNTLAAAASGIALAVAGCLDDDGDDNGGDGADEGSGDDEYHTFSYELVVDPTDPVRLDDEFEETIRDGVCVAIDESEHISPPSAFDCAEDTTVSAFGPADRGEEGTHFHANVEHRFESEDDARSVARGYVANTNNVVHDSWLEALDDAVDEHIDTELRGPGPHVFPAIDQDGTTIEYELVVDTEDEVALDDDLEAAILEGMCAGVQHQPTVETASRYGGGEHSPPDGWVLREGTTVDVSAHGDDETARHVHAEVTHEFDTEDDADAMNSYLRFAHLSVDDVWEQALREAVESAYGTDLQGTPFTRGETSLD